MTTRENRNAAQRDRMERNRNSFFKGKSCASCGSKINLELDHIIPALKVSHRIWSNSDQYRFRELLKCQVLCRICHRKKTKSEMQKPIVHGTTSGYRNGCRCDECKKEKALSAWAYSERKKNQGTSVNTQKSSAKF